MGSNDIPSMPRGRLSRRHFLAGLGAGTAGAVASASGAGLIPRLGADAAAAAPAEARIPAGKFGRMFRLPPFAGPSPRVTDALLDIAKPGGLLDARDNLAAGPVALILDPALSANNPNNPTHTAGTTFMGQFLDHDVTFDVGSALGRPTAPEQATNGRTPAFDLDSVYGRGPFGSRELYDPSDRAKFFVENGGLFEDLPRLAGGSAVVADPRNDEHVIIAGLQCAFLRFHNRALSQVRRGGVTDFNEAFTAARRLTTWHYQWMILHEFLPQFVGQAMVDDVVARGRRFFTPSRGQAFIPVEFQGAVYRMGHSMVRPSYRANLRGDGGGAFFAFIFDAAHSDESDPNDLSGGKEAAMAVGHTCRECGERFEVDMGVTHAVGRDAFHRDVECPRCGAEQRVKAPTGPRK